jgi:hypothetical protein
MSRFSCANPPAVAFDDRQWWGTLGTLCESVVGLRVGIATLSQFATNIMNHSLDGLRRDGLTGHLFHHNRGTFE